DKVPGLAYAVVLDGKVAHLKTYGVKEIGKEDKIDQYTVFRIASVSKTFASTAAAVLVQKNILAWDSRVKPYLKDIDFRDKSYGQELRVHHLLSHSTGLVQHAYTNLINQNVKYSEIEKLIKKVKFVCKPGDCYGYQNVIYSLVGDIVEYLSGNKYEKFVSKYLFEPLQMNHASFGLNAFMENGNAAVPHKRKNDQWLAVKVKPNFYAVAPAAGVNASISDMSKWLLAQLGNSPEVLSQRILDDMHTRRIKTTKGQAHYGQWENLDTAYYGLGWRLFDYHGWTGFVHHGGWVQGFRTEMVFNPDLDMGMVILVNAQGVHVNNAVPAFIDLYMELGSDKLAQTKVDNRKDKSDN
ncbi:MAG: beta-lactamase family protein, partial [Gammaproteobacteria bacterium]|nr:beta-lactamase family protein [Gammaproteobacteria bacterium]